MAREYLSDPDEAPAGVPVEKDEDGDWYVDKRRVYIDSPAEAPESAEVSEGDRGGYYYDTDDAGGVENVAEELADQISTESDYQTHEGLMEATEQIFGDEMDRASTDEKVEAIEEMFGEEVHDLPDEYMPGGVENIAESNFPRAVSLAARGLNFDQLGRVASEEELEDAVESFAEGVETLAEDMEDSSDEQSAEARQVAEDVRSVDTQTDDYTVYQNSVEVLEEQTDVNDMSPEEAQQVAEDVFGEGEVDDLFFEQLGGEDVADAIENGRPPADIIGEVMTGIMYNNRGSAGNNSEEELQESREEVIDDLAENIDEFMM
jgi:hypothetical protein